jgi:putative transposase
LLETFELTAVNQVWASDITYYRIGEKFYYLTFILDLYSRVIVGYAVSINLDTASTTIAALKMAAKVRKVPAGLIIHSDGGGQYYCKAWLQLTSFHKMRNSMCESVYGNAHAERINGVIKNDYLEGYGPGNYNQLRTSTAKAVRKYNTEKPHGALDNISPVEFEKVLNAA